MGRALLGGQGGGGEDPLAAAPEMVLEARPDGGAVQAEDAGAQLLQPSAQIAEPARAGGVVGVGEVGEEGRKG